MCSDPAWGLLHSLIRDLRQAGAVSASEWLCSGGASRHLIGCWTHEHVSWWLGSQPLCCWCWQAVVSSAWLFCFVVVIWSSASISSAQPGEAEWGETGRRTSSRSYLLILYSGVLLSSYQLVSKFPSFCLSLARMVAHSNTVSASDGRSRSRREGCCSSSSLPFITLLLGIITFPGTHSCATFRPSFDLLDSSQTMPPYLCHIKVMFLHTYKYKCPKHINISKEQTHTHLEKNKNKKKLQKVTVTAHMAGDEDLLLLRNCCSPFFFFFWLRGKMLYSKT